MTPTLSFYSFITFFFNRVYVRSVIVSGTSETSREIFKQFSPVQISLYCRGTFLNSNAFRSISFSLLEGLTLLVFFNLLLYLISHNVGMWQQVLFLSLHIYVYIYIIHKNVYWMREFRCAIFPSRTIAYFYEFFKNFHMCPAVRQRKRTFLFTRPLTLLLNKIQ